jgi:hypothetical protein
MVEIETVLLPITFGGRAPERFLGVAQVLSDVAPLLGRYISFERLVHGTLIREGESKLDEPAPPAPPPPPPESGRRVGSHAPHLRLVVSRESKRAEEDAARFDGGVDFAAVLAAAGAAFGCPEAAY